MLRGLLLSYSVAPDAQITLRRFFQFAAFLSETFVFAYLGLQVRGPQGFAKPLHILSPSHKPVAAGV